MEPNGVYYMYILECSDGSYYIGTTSDLELRLDEHSSGSDVGSYTFGRRPVTLCYYIEFSDRELALICSTQIRKWSRAKKAALVAGNYELLPALAKKKFARQGSGARRS